MPRLTPVNKVRSLTCPRSGAGTSRLRSSPSPGPTIHKACASTPHGSSARVDSVSSQSVAALPIERIENYLARLPGRIDSHPDAQVKYSIIETWVDGHDLARLVEAVPPPVRPMLEHGFPVTRWVPEVHATTVYLALRELFFPSDDAFVADAHERNVQLLSKPMYRILMRFIGPDRAAKGAALAFSQMHRGVNLDVDSVDGAWVVRIDHPPHLVPELLCRCYATAVRAVLELKGYAGVRSKLTELRPERTTILVEYQG